MPARIGLPLVSANLVIPQPDFFDGAEQSAADSELRNVPRCRYRFVNFVR